MGDVGERPAVDERRIILERLDEVGLDRLGEQHRHRAVGPEVARGNRPPGDGGADDDPAEAVLEIGDAVGEAQDRHYFGRDGYVEARRAGLAGQLATGRQGDFAKRAVVHVEHAPPHDPRRIKVERIAPIEVIVDHRREQIVGRCDGVEIAGEMKVDLLHRRDLRAAAAGGAALHPETGSERRFAQAQQRLAPGAAQRVGEPDRSGGLALPRQRRADRGDQDQPAVRAGTIAAEPGEIDLRLGVAKGFDGDCGNGEAGGDLPDRQEGRGAGEVKVGRHGHS